MKLHFTKMQGAGNDFIFINNLKSDLVITPELAKRLCDRCFGVGADQLLIVAPSQTQDFKMEIYNADGSQVEMCGNGIRCFAKYVLDNKLIQKKSFRVETLAGVIKPEVITDHPLNAVDTLWVRVDMGIPVLEGRDIPVNQNGLVMNQLFKLQGSDPGYFITCVSMGNPHCVIFVEDVDVFPVQELGPQIEHHPFFPKRTNVEFVQVIDEKSIKMRVWERGAGETLACGTGACATAVACILNHKTDRRIIVHLPGGNLEIAWEAHDNHVFMTGPATTVFEGEISC